jgi:NADPH-dependent ferric siderophore reductase
MGPVTQTVERDAATRPFRVFDVCVSRVVRLSPSFVRVTLTGADLDRFADNGFDQRIKLAFPESPVAEAHLPSGADWYRRWRELPEDHRSPIRTYTVRAVRPRRLELDVDIVLHDGVDQGGPACRWARRARPGDRIAVLGPVAGYDGDHGGIGFRPPAGGGPLLLAGDETAAPAIAAILERLPGDARGLALLEVPYPEDVLEVGAPSGVVVRWLPRHGRAPGCELVPAVQRAAAGPDLPVYTWLAGEAGVVTALRRHLVAERDFDRASVTFMGYWRRGRTGAEAA